MTKTKNQKTINSIVTENKNINPNKSWFEAKVVKGKGRGKKLGFPTINLDYKMVRLQDYKKIKLYKSKSIGLQDYKHGVYLCQIEIPSNLMLYQSKHLKTYGLLHFGPRTTFAELKPVLEIYILNFGSKIKIGTLVNFKIVKFLRPTKKFLSRQQLKKQIRKDIQIAKKLIKVLE